MIAKLGGFIGRKNDGFPGPHVIAKGFRRLSDIKYILKQVGIKKNEKILEKTNMG
jgi:hypothetical protein